MQKAKHILLTQIIISFFIFSVSFCSSVLKIYFLDVGQGDASIIITPLQKMVLIDSGDCDEYHDYGEDVVKFITKLGFKKINAVIISHPHRDHIGGLEYVLSKLPVESFYDPGYPYPSYVYQRVLEIVKHKNIKYTLARKDTKISIDENVELKILYPPKELVFDDPNNNSVVLRVKYKDISVLFTGDIEKKAELEIVRLYKRNQSIISSNILKIPHHGSITSSTKEFLKLVSPEVGIISCGRNNRFGHPHRQVLNRYEDFGIEIYRTDIHGTLEVIIDGEDYIIKPIR